MIAAVAAAIFVIASLICVLTVVQMFYLESLRLRTREFASQQFFKEHVDERMGLKSENGALVFSLLKHGLLSVLGVVFYVFSTGAGGPRPFAFAEAAGLSFVTMLASAYLLPQLLYRRTACRWVVPLVPMLRFLALLARPLTALLGLLQALADVGNSKPETEEPATAAENIEALISAGAEEGIIEEEDRKLIQSAAAFGSKTVREVMTARPEIVAISADATLADLRQLVVKEQYSRIPAHEGNVDAIIGFVHVRDMFELEEGERRTRRVRELVRPISFVPETKPVDDLLREMQQEGNHMAVVIDEYGNTAGLVTMEDMVEEIVGEIRDEHEPGHDIRQDELGGYIVSGSFDVDHLRELVDFRAEEDTESTTIGGLVTEWAGHVPQPGETVERDGVRVEVLSASELRVDQVRVSRVETGQSENA